jgi:hypothetical protein
MPIGGIIVDPSAPSPLVGLGNERSVIQYNNIINSTSQFTVQGNDNDKGFLIDGMTTSSWLVPSNDTSITITTSGTIDCVALSPSNWRDSSATVYIDIVTAQGQSNVYTQGSFENDAPIMAVFEPQIVTSVIIRLVSNGQLRVTGFSVGKCLRFPCGVSVGYQPGRWTTINQVNNFRTESNAFGQNTVFQRGTEERFTIDLIEQDWMNDNWPNFLREAIGKQIWFGWNSVDYPRQVTYGNWTIPRPSYESSTFTSVSMSINGLSV